MAATDDATLEAQMEREHAAYLERARTGDLPAVVDCLREWSAVESVPAQDEFDVILARLEEMTRAGRTHWTESGDLATEGRCVFRQVGWQGQTGAFYPDEAAARAGERGGYSPVYVQVSPE